MTNLIHSLHRQSVNRDAQSILIVGAGPTGMMAALVLARMGVRCRIIDAANVRSEYSRALVVHARSLELLAKLGLASELVQQGRKALRTRLVSETGSEGKLELGDMGLDETAFPFVLFLSQVHTEAVLEAALQQAGVEVERPVRLVELSQDDAGVDVQLQGEVLESARFDYVVGCDGAHSVVRKALGLKFEGDAYPQEFLLGDVTIDADLDPNTLHLFLRREGIVALFPLEDPAPWRVITVAGTRDGANEGPLRLEELQATAERIGGLSLPLRDPQWLSRFHLHHRGVDAYARGRVFVAGDAAHIHSPAGGQGMNTGLQDAFNLAWKLAWTAQSAAKPALLESYHPERYPVGQFLLGFTDRMFSLATHQAPWVRFVRSRIVPRVVPRAMRLRPLRRRMLQTLSQLGIRYRSSPAIASNTRAPATVQPGERLPDGRLSQSSSATRLSELLHELRYHLLLVADPSDTVDVAGIDELSRRYGDRLGVVTLAHTSEELPALGPELRQRLGIRAATAILVRPDGHVAAVSPAGDLATLASALDEWLVPAVAVR